jgi:hypothetical protein
MLTYLVLIQDKRDSIEIESHRAGLNERSETKVNDHPALENQSEM